MTQNNCTCLQGSKDHKQDYDLMDGVTVLKKSIVTVDLNKHGDAGKFGRVLRSVGEEVSDKKILFAWTDQEKNLAIIVLTP